MGKVHVFETRQQAEDELQQYVTKNFDAMGKLYERVKADYKVTVNIGEGLEFACMVDLLKDDREYMFTQYGGTHSGDFNSEDYSTIEALVEGLQQRIRQVKHVCYGAKATPVIYTVKEEETFSQEQREEVKAALQDPELLALPPELQEFSREFVEGMLSMPSLHGLSEGELAEFETKFYGA